MPRMLAVCTFVCLSVVQDSECLVLGSGEWGWGVFSFQVRRYLAARPELFATDAATCARNFEDQEAFNFQLLAFRYFVVSCNL